MACSSDQCVVCVFSDQRCLVSTTSAVETICFVGTPEELFFVRGVKQVGTLLYDPRSWGLERMLRRSREGRASSRGPLIIQYLRQFIACAGPDMWVAPHVVGTVGMGWEEILFFRILRHQVSIR